MTFVRAPRARPGAGGTLPPNFVNLFGLTRGALANALTQLDGEVATGAGTLHYTWRDKLVRRWPATS